MYMNQIYGIPKHDGQQIGQNYRQLIIHVSVE